MIMVCFTLDDPQLCSLADLRIHDNWKCNPRRRRSDSKVAEARVWAETPGGDSHTKVTGVIVAKFEKNP